MRCGYGIGVRSRLQFCPNLRQNWSFSKADMWWKLCICFLCCNFSNETALFLLDLTDRTPNRFDMTFPATYNLTNVKKEQIIALTVKKEWYEEGILQVRSPGENNIKVYNMERTLCDILRKRSGVDAGIIVEACKRYAEMHDIEALCV